MFAQPAHCERLRIELNFEWPSARVWAACDKAKSQKSQHGGPMKLSAVMNPFRIWAANKGSGKWVSKWSHLWFLVTFA